ncbi:hypothetical protein MMC24_000930 [Lignoscripta atroalba]|nr:hypothetical protein [Lignoscripta atroalba]
MVKYGMAAWGVLAWTMISSLLPLRRLAYELFVLQHLVSAGIFLWLLHVHVPAYASYNIWMAIGFVAFDRVIRGCWFLYRNATLRSDLLKRFGGKRIGHRTNMEAVAGDITLLTIQDVKFAWKPGQHIRLWCPSIGLFESHPFTISNVPIDKQVNTTSVPDVIQLRIRAHSGFTRRLYRLAASPQRSVSVPITTFITGPLGASPTWNTFETIVLISASTGASFTLPILESILKDPCCVCRVDFLLLIRHRSHMEGVLERLKRASSHPRSSEVFLRIQIAITGNCNEPGNGDDIKIELQSSSESETSGSGSKSLLCSGPTKTQYSSSPYAEITFEKERSPLDSQDEQEVGLSISETPQDDFSSGSGREDLLHFMKGRPNLADVIRNPVEAAAGETSIIVCGGKSLTSDVRNIVASLSDERAVHKGSGAQGIHLHVEEYGL